MDLPRPFIISFRTGFCLGLILISAIGLYLFFLWQPDEQVRLHTHHLLKKIEKRDWNGVGNFVARNYRDEWNDDRDRLLERMRLVLAAVRVLNIDTQDELTIAAGRTGRLRAKIRVTTDRGEFAVMIEDRINSLNAPFEFEWRQQSSKPWDWKLVAVKNPALEVPEGFD